jgi:hypothetical protein
MRRLGADCSVVAMKRGNARGAKGAGHRHLARVNRQREEPDVQWKAAAFARWHEPDDARVSSPVVCPAKAGMFSRRQPCRGNSQAPRSLDSRVAGNQDSEAYRQGLPWGDYESPGRNESERASGLENEWIRGPSLQLKGEGSMGCRNLTDAACRSRRGGSDSTVARTCRATGEALFVPERNHRSKVDRITGTTGKTIEGERVADGSVVAMKRSNVRGAKGPYCL